MFCEEILTKEIPSLKEEMTGTQAHALMEELKLKHLPVTKDNKYIYLLSEKDLFEMNDMQEKIGNISYFAPCISRRMPVTEILRIVSKNRLTYLPVVDETGELLGGVTLPLLTDRLNDICNSAPFGALIGIEVNPQDFVLSQIIHLIESNNARVLLVFSYPEEETSRQLVVLKVDLEDATPVLRSLERFNYVVRFYYQKQGVWDETMKNRLNELIYYLEM